MLIIKHAKSNRITAPWKLSSKFQLPMRLKVLGHAVQSKPKKNIE